MLDEAFEDQNMKESFYVEISYPHTMDFQQLQTMPPIVNHKVSTIWMLHMGKEDDDPVSGKSDH